MRKTENKIYTINNDEHLLTERICIARCLDLIEIYLHLQWNNRVGIQTKTNRWLQKTEHDRINLQKFDSSKNLNVYINKF